MNTHINKNRKAPEYTREYTGVTITAANYREILEKEGRAGINLHTKHLQAYLKGKKDFQYGYMRSEDGRVLKDGWGFPLKHQHKVKSKLKKIEKE